MRISEIRSCAAMLGSAIFVCVAGTRPAAADPVSFARDIHPILMESCSRCHTGAEPKAGFSLANREAVLRGGDSGPAAVPGDPASSLIVRMIDEGVRGVLMPPEGDLLPGESIDLIRRWIAEGMEWDLEIKGPERPFAPLAPRHPKPPGGATTADQAIDRFVEAYLGEQGIAAAAPVPDEVFARRAYLDVIGLLPTPEELAEFLAAPGRDKHAVLIDELLARDGDYAEHWMTFWNDALRNDFVGTGYIDGGRKQITTWLYRALAENKPYDEFIRELISPDTESMGFIRGIVWRGVTNASQTPAMQAAQNVGQIFMGTNLKCASCHNSFINGWKLADAYGLAAVFSEEPLELVRCDKPLGTLSEVKFLFPELGAIDAAKPRLERQAVLADIMTKPENGRLARTMVNRLWAKFMGRGLVEPVDDMDQPCWNQDLLDWLASDLADNGWDLKRTMRLILTSRSYRLPAVARAESSGEEFVFRGPMVRRIGAEQLMDAISSITGHWPGSPATDMDLETRPEIRQRERDQVMKHMENARWIWAPTREGETEPADLVWFRRSFVIPEEVKFPLRRARLFITADNEYVAWVNAEKAGEGKNWQKLDAIDVTARLGEGRNLLAVQGKDGGGPAGLIAALIIEGAEGEVTLTTDGEWLVTDRRTDNWNEEKILPLGWMKVADGGEVNAWRNADNFADTLRRELLGRERNTRAWHTTADPLARALGRPNREQVVTRRDSLATTLQSLEVANGAGLDARLRAGAELLIRSAEGDSGKLIERVWLHGLARLPTPEEREIAISVIESGSEGGATASGVADFLWIFINLPEFQFI